MTPRKKIIIALITLALTVMALRETPFVDLNFYQSYSNSSFNSTINTNSSFTTVGRSNAKAAPNYSSQDLSIVIMLGKDTVYRRINKLVPIVVKINELQTGSLWIPLYKSYTFSALGVPSFDSRQKLEGKVPKGSYKIEMSGHFEMNGQLVIKGFCSHKEAVKLVKEQIVQNFSAKIMEQFASLSPEYIQAMSNSQSQRNL